MFLNIGADVDIYCNDVVAVINLEKDDGKINSEFIDVMRRKKDCIILDKDVIRSIVVLSRNGKSRIYLSPVSVFAIKKRMEFICKN